MPENFNYSKKYKKLSIYFYFGIAVVIILVIGLFKDSLFAPLYGGEVIIDRLEAGSFVYVDKIEKRVINRLEENIKLKKLSLGSHSILIVRPGFWPWMKEVEIKDSDQFFLSPFSVPENHNGFLITEGTEEYEALVHRFNSFSAPNANKPKISADGKLIFWIDQSQLFVEWLGSDKEMPKAFCNKDGCKNIIVSLVVGGEIRNVDFYKDREDVLMVAFGNGIFAVEIDKNGHQNFQPVFEGQAPNFIKKDQDAIYILDQAILRELIL